MYRVDAQQARRVLDRIVGFELSPVLWKKVKPALSAGRVQSVAVRLIVEREREISAFKPEAAYRVIGEFLLPGGELLKRNLLIYGLGGIIVPFICIKIIDVILVGLGLV